MTYFRWLWSFTVSQSTFKTIYWQNHVISDHRDTRKIKIIR